MKKPFPVVAEKAKLSKFNYGRTAGITELCAVSKGHRDLDIAMFLVTALKQILPPSHKAGLKLFSHR